MKICGNSGEIPKNFSQIYFFADFLLISLKLTAQSENR